MKAILEILPVDLDAYKCTLVFEINNEGFSYAIKDDDENTYISVAVFHTDKNAAGDDYPAILENELQRQTLFSRNFKKIHVMHSLGESVLIPFSLYSSPENAHVLNLIHGDLQSDVSILADIIPGKAMYNAYRVPTPVLNIMRSKFPDAINIHQHSVLLNQLPPEGDRLLVIIYRKQIVVMLIKEGITHFINNFSYVTEDDVLYILLNTCKQFELENVPLEISGLVETNSSLSKGIHKYFDTVSFTTLPAGPAYTEEIIKYPAHYFSYIFAADS